MVNRVSNVVCFLLYLCFFCISSLAQAATTEQVSVSNTGDPGKGYNIEPSVSHDGRYIVFISPASNLVPGDTNGAKDVFLRDRQTGTTVRVSVSSAGEEQQFNTVQFTNVNGASVSADGRYVAFDSEAYNLVSGDTNGYSDVFVRDLQTGTTEVVSATSAGVSGNGASMNPFISADGRYVVFVSDAYNLVAGLVRANDAVFVHDRLTHTTELVSISSAGVQAGYCAKPSITPDGRYVTFSSGDAGLMSGDRNYTYDIFVHDRQTQTTECVSLTPSGTVGNYRSEYPSISADGRYVVFYSYATDLIAGDTNGVYDVFVYDRQARTMERVSVSGTGEQANAQSLIPSMSSDGRYVAFYSWASNLVSGDTNGYSDVFVYDRQTREIERASVSSNGQQGWNRSEVNAISPDGSVVAFQSWALLAGTSTYGYQQVYARVRDTDSVPPVSSIIIDCTAGLNGWCISNAQVTLSAVDNDGGSGVAFIEYRLNGGVWTTYSSPFVISVEGTTLIEYKATDNRGNPENPPKTRTAMIDKTVPMVLMTVPEQGRIYAFNELVAVDWSASDLVSDILTVDATAPVGSQLLTATVGAKNFFVTATDRAGNVESVTSTYYVHYLYSGILPPINSDGSSLFQGGRSVPVKFRLTDAGGFYVSSATVRLYYAKFSNGIIGTESQVSSTSEATVGNLFRYDAGDNLYIFNLDMKALDTGTWQIRIELDDGTSQYATFSVK